MHRLHIRLRLTHKYVGTWQHEDRWRGVGVVKITPWRMARAPQDDFADGGTYVRFATLPAGLNAHGRALFRQALQDSLSSRGCSHEYDCCGCRSDETWAYPTSDPRRVRLVTHVGFNY